MISDNLWQLVQASSEQHPEALALCAADQQFTFQELVQEVYACSAYLLEQGVTEHDRVGILLPRTSDMVIGLLAVLAIGACYVPLSERYPKVRNQAIIDDSGCSFLLGNEHFSGVKLLDAKKRLAIEKTFLLIPKAITPKTAYIIYTSGSTGTPKGVMISHANALAMIQWANTVFAKEVLQYTLASTSICFDLSIFELFVPLSVGGCVVLVENALALIDKPQQHPLTLINTVPSAARELLAHQAIPNSVRVINLAGEALEQSLVNSLYEQTVAEQIYNLYGPSETTTYSTYHLAPHNAPATMVPIGKPILGTELFLLDQHQIPVPPRAKGELYIAGKGVTQGYCNRPEETASRYINIPGTTSLAYRTGDLVRLNEQGDYDYLGRLDHQVKIHGFRIELDEIVKAIQAHPQVKQAVVVAIALARSTQELAAYVVLHEPNCITEQAVRQSLLACLPDYMVPRYVCFLEHMPLNANGKIDRLALPPIEQEIQGVAVTTDTKLEQELKTMWCTLLSLTHINNDDHFFYIGGHSLLAARLLIKLKAAFNIECQLNDLFRYPTIATQAQMIAERSSSFIKQNSSLFTLKRPESIPLSYGQERLWYLQYAEQNTPISNIPILITIKGALDVQAFEASMSEVIKRHEVLRTVYERVGQHIIQRINTNVRFKIAIKEVLDAAWLEAELAREANKPFDLRQDLMIRATLFVQSAQESVLLLTQHHIASDAWSLNILMTELSALYKAFHRAQTVPVLKQPAQYADYSCWQRSAAGEACFEHDLRYWQGQLSGAPDSVLLPYDYKQNKATATYAGAFHTWELESSLVAELKTLAQQHECTLFMVLLTAFSALLYRYSNQTDLCIGILSGSRPLDELDNALGFFVNTLVMRHQLNVNTTGAQFLEQVRTTVLEGLAHQQVPFDKLVDALRTQRTNHRHPLFNVLFSVQNALDTDLHLDELTLELSEFDRKIAKFDLTLSLVERQDRLLAIFEYNTDLFHAHTIERMVGHYTQILKTFTHALQQPIAAIEMLSTAERILVLNEVNKHQYAPLPGAHIADLFEETVRIVPNKIAVITDAESLTFSELNQRANQVARMLMDFGADNGTPIGIVLPRSIHALISMLAILKVGGHYIPMDPNWPTERLDVVIRDAGINLLITSHNASAHLISSPMLFPLFIDEVQWEEQTELPSMNRQDERCYIMFTSGSTGQPKGIVAQHTGVIRLVKNTNYVLLNNEKRLLQVSPLAFDGSTFDIWGSLLNGATLVLMPDGIPELGKLASALSSYQITTLFITTQLFNNLVEHKLDSLHTLEQIFFGGEAASTDHVTRFKERYPRCSLNNIYGPTECTSFALNYFIPDDFDKTAPLPLGRPITNTCALILSEGQQICPINVPGEIYLGGLGLAQGYLNQDELTKKQFVANTYPELNTTLLYRTGDLGCYRADGEIVFLGRADHQVKLRGYRIELPEIEQALRGLPHILDAVVLVQKPEDILVAYVTHKTGSSLECQSIRQALSLQLPHYMLPDALQLMSEFPLNSNGKIDKQQLPRWHVTQHSELTSTGEALEEHNSIYPIIRSIWAEVLGHEHINPQDNFFEIGGNSLKIILVLDRLQDHYQNNPTMLAKLDITALFQYSTLRALADYFGVGLPELEPVVVKMKRVNQRDKRKAARVDY